MAKWWSRKRNLPLSHDNPSLGRSVEPNAAVFALRKVVENCQVDFSDEPAIQDHFYVDDLGLLLALSWKTSSVMKNSSLMNRISNATLVMKWISPFERAKSLLLEDMDLDWLPVEKTFGDPLGCWGSLFPISCQAMWKANDQERHLEHHKLSEWPPGIHYPLHHQSSLLRGLQAEIWMGLDSSFWDSAAVAEVDGGWPLHETMRCLGLAKSRFAHFQWCIHFGLWGCCPLESHWAVVIGDVQIQVNMNQIHQHPSFWSLCSSDCSWVEMLYPGTTTNLPGTPKLYLKK